MQPIQREINTIVIHCADTPNGKAFTVEDIDNWHRDRGFSRVAVWRVNKAFNPGLTSIGYHFVIYSDGSVHTGRHPDEIGAHVTAHNSRSLGICLVGKDKFTPRQWASLKQLVTDLRDNIKAGQHQLNATVVGHCSFDTAKAQGKTCPNFDVPVWFAAGMFPDQQHVLVTEVP